MLQGIAVDTPTLRALTDSRRLKADYVFRLTEHQVKVGREVGLPDSALLALAAISGAAYGDRSQKWVTLPQRTTDAFGRGYKWWHRATSALEQAGLIQCERHPGRLPRYRLLSTESPAGRSTPTAEHSGRSQ
jgi:hypothetical protein